MIKYFDFEKEIKNIDTTIDKYLNEDTENIAKIQKLELKKKQLFNKIYSSLDPWQKVQVSRHNERPHTIDYLKLIFEDVIFLHGDKKYADDQAIIGGFAKIDNQSVIFIGNEKGNSMNTRIQHNFGMANQRDIEKHNDCFCLLKNLIFPL